jgi:basic membrane lipoprotein Med (substrate-binding protein (PBP1-ABC) superfamily)
MSRKKCFASCVLPVIVVLILVLAGSVTPADAAVKKLKVAFALLWTIDDQGWTTATYHGIEYLQEKMGDQIEVSYTEKVLAADAERVFRNYAQQGYDIIFGTTFEHMDPMLNVAKDYPDIVFEHCSGFKTAANMGNYFARMYQGEYLAGYMAGLMGYKKVGTVATNPIPEPIRGINAFTIGLLKGLVESGHTVDPNSVNTVVWLKAWRDAINETTLAETLVARKHDLIRQMADTPDSSVAACAAGIPAIGYGEDAARYGADCALVSTVWNWGPIYVEKVKQVMDGTWKADEYWGGFDKNDIILSDFNAAVPEEVQQKVLAAKKKLEAGEDDIFAGPLYDQQGNLMVPEGQKASDKDLLTMRWLVKGVNGSIPQ